MKIDELTWLQHTRMSSSQAYYESAHTIDPYAPLRKMHVRIKRTGSFSIQSEAANYMFMNSRRGRGRSPTMRLDATNGTYTAPRPLPTSKSPTSDSDSTIILTSAEAFNDLPSITKKECKPRRKKSTLKTIAKKVNGQTKPRKQPKKQKEKKLKTQAPSDPSQMADVSKYGLQVSERDVRAAKRAHRALPLSTNE